MIFSFDNNSIDTLITERAVIRNSIQAGSDVTVKLDDNNNFSQNDFILLGQPQNPKSEIAKISQVVSPGSDIVVDELIFAHSPYSPVYKMPYDKVRLYNALTSGGAKTLLEERDIDVDQRYTDFEISDVTTGFLYFTLYNTQTAEESDYSSEFSATEYTSATVGDIKRKIERYYPNGIDDETLRDLLEIVISNVYGERKWRFREKTTTFTTTDGTTKYNIVDDVGITDFGTLVSVRTDTEPLSILTNDEEDITELTSAMLIDNTFAEWGGYFYIKVNGAKDITIKYLNTPPQLYNAGDKVDKIMVNALVYGILAELYVTEDTDLADRFEVKYVRAIKKMKQLDEKDIEIKVLTGLRTVTNRIITPNIIPD